MNFKKYLTEFGIVFTIAFVAAAIVSFLYSLIIHGKGDFDWGISFRLGIILGIILPWIQSRAQKK